MQILILFIIAGVSMAFATAGFFLHDQEKERVERYVRRFEKYAAENQRIKDELTAKSVEVINLNTELKHQKDLLNYALTHPQDYIK